MARRREFSIFSLSFLDVMSCGFGATLLVFLMLDHSSDVESQKINAKLLSEVDFLDREVRDGRVNLVELRNTIARVTDATAVAQGRAREIIALIAKRKEELSSSDKDSLAKTEHLNALKADVKQLEEENRRLRAEGEKSRGSDARRISGDGDRQYLTGLKLGGKRILILLDRSASMLDNSLVNVLRMRNMPPAAQQRSRKWQNALNTVDWLSSRLPPTSEYQVYAFNVAAQPLLPASAGKWLPVSDRTQLDHAMEEMRKLTPSGGTSLVNAFNAAAAMNPKPDNIYLITDGLPTQGATVQVGGKVSGRDRLKYFNQALGRLPNGVPVNVILAPMEGDPNAASVFWQLAQATRGAFLAPSKDWP